MADAKSFRKPYKREASWNWWTENPFFVRYMLREGTAVMALFAVLEIVLGVFLFALCAYGDPEDPDTVAPYMWFVQDFLSNPIVIVLNILALAAQLYHMVTWFNLMPKAVRVFMNKNSTELLPDYITKIGLYAAAVGGFVVVLGAALLTK